MVSTLLRKLPFSPRRGFIINLRSNSSLLSFQNTYYTCSNYRTHKNMCSSHDVIASGLSVRHFSSDEFPKSPSRNKDNNSEISLTKRITKQIKNFKDLSKFNLSMLVVATSLAGYMCVGVPVDPVVLGATCVGTGLCSASANTFNQWIEVDRDAKMKRTRARPLPSGRCTPNTALTWGVIAGSTGVTTLYTLTNPVVAAIGAANIFLYAGPYTFSKRSSEVNTWIGAVVGALPPLMGWAAASGGDVLVPDALALASLLFLWQFPHFFALAWVHREDYARGSFQMVPVNDPTGERTSRLITRYSLYLTAFPLAVTSMGLTSSMFAVEGMAANAYLLYLAKKFSDDKSDKNARSVFYCSLWYLPLLLTAFVFHSRMWMQEERQKRGQLDESSLMNDLRNALRSVCAHEVLTQKSEGDFSALCPTVISETVSNTQVVSVEQAHRLLAGSESSSPSGSVEVLAATPSASGSDGSTQTKSERDPTSS